jgi:hypothetical protein
VPYDSAAVDIALNVALAKASLDVILARSRLGIAIAAMIKMMATTISSSMREKPLCRLFLAASVLWLSLHIVVTVEVPLN